MHHQQQQQQQQSDPNDLLVAGKYQVQRQISHGAFGTIYLAYNLQNHNEVAIKFERTDVPRALLQHEAHVYRQLKGGNGIPRLLYFGKAGDFNALVLEMLGDTLEQLFVKCERIFSLKTVLMLAEQLIARLEFIHAKCYIHGDIKPENFLNGQETRSTRIYAIDFGLSCKYRDSESGKHISYRDGRSLTGTPRYASINGHLGIQQSRRDDMESLGYMLIYFLKGSLPWQGLAALNKQEKILKIGEMKMKTSIDELCADVPAEFGRYLHHVRGLQFEEQPDYKYLKALFSNLFSMRNFKNDSEFDWILLMRNRRRITPQPTRYEATSNESQYGL